VQKRGRRKGKRQALFGLRGGGWKKYQRKKKGGEGEQIATLSWGGGRKREGMCLPYPPFRITSKPDVEEKKQRKGERRKGGEKTGLAILPR